MIAAVDRDSVFVAGVTPWFGPKSFEVVDPTTWEVLLHIRDVTPSRLARFLRSFGLHRLVRWRMTLSTPDGRVHAELRRGWSCFRSRTDLTDAAGRTFATIAEPLVSLSPKFDISDASGRTVGTLRRKMYSGTFNLEWSGRPSGAATSAATPDARGKIRLGWWIEFPRELGRGALQRTLLVACVPMLDLAPGDY